MRLFNSLLIFTALLGAALSAQTIVQEARVTATAGDLICAGTPTADGNSISLECRVGAAVVMPASLVTPPTGNAAGVTLSVSMGTAGATDNRNITMTLRRPDAAIKTWSCAAIIGTGPAVTRSGTW